ncbi:MULTISPECIES: hypothetical protein [Lysinibacillus]|uniref:hypothetical protein n=1 Tax=Lysinibacillus TaxID=400634 RepID=UPI00257AF640|nr:MULTISPECIES: hypothetical protein [Lysinibacillus]
MKISKIVVGLVVCGTLIFPGALSSSAQEVNSTVSTETINYSTGQETKLLTSTSTNPRMHFTVIPYYAGETYEYTMITMGKHYRGTLYYQSKDKWGYYYTGWMYEYTP